MVPITPLRLVPIQRYRHLGEVTIKSTYQGDRVTNKSNHQEDKVTIKSNHQENKVTIKSNHQEEKVILWLPLI